MLARKGKEYKLRKGVEAGARLIPNRVDISQQPTIVDDKSEVGHRYKGQGFGEWLLIDALRKLLMVSETVAFPVVIVDAKDGAEYFYEKYGSRRVRNELVKLGYPCSTNYVAKIMKARGIRALNGKGFRYRRRVESTRNVVGNILQALYR